MVNHRTRSWRGGWRSPLYSVRNRSFSGRRAWWMLIASSSQIPRVTAKRSPNPARTSAARTSAAVLRFVSGSPRRGRRPRAPNSSASWAPRRRRKAVRIEFAFGGLSVCTGPVPLDATECSATLTEVRRSWAALFSWLAGHGRERWRRRAACPSCQRDGREWRSSQATGRRCSGSSQHACRHVAQQPGRLGRLVTRRRTVRRQRGSQDRAVSARFARRGLAWSQVTAECRRGGVTRELARQIAWAENLVIGPGTVIVDAVDDDHTVTLADQARDRGSDSHSTLVRDCPDGRKTGKREVTPGTGVSPQGQRHQWRTVELDSVTSADGKVAVVQPRCRRGWADPFATGVNVDQMRPAVQ